MRSYLVRPRSPSSTGTLGQAPTAYIPPEVSPVNPVARQLRDSTRSRALVARRQYAAGGALDSQTTDSQFVRNLTSTEGERNATSDSAGVEEDTTLVDEHCSNGKGNSDSVNGCDCKDQLEKAQAKLTRLWNQINQLGGRLAYYEHLCAVHTSRIDDLERELQDRILEEEDRYSEFDEPWLDPDEESQVLVYPEPVLKKRRCAV
ncbi:hypothetical protein BN946_scf184791.g3 [Trametes cinnabarina]|uniref:Uncharacterized protein n=1 Tax=Pycnoporus cinnabarinus TaxID=5643 RepID=A0A060SAJ6_PYCCI|nr:hypothetical protein BN946_scf184791.g3 [Trametes cinnabarina]